MRELKAKEQDWINATVNLQKRREERGYTDDNRKLDNVVRDYHLHLSKVFVGKSVLDVGCGNQFLKRCLPDGVDYLGIEAFPVELDSFKGNIESESTLNILKSLDFETVCAFAVMDNCLDFDKAIENMKLIATKNIVFLTGVDIPVDKFHTFELTLNDFDERFTDWKHGYREELTPKVWLLEYKK